MDNFKLIAVILFCLLCSCSREGLAPVVELNLDNGYKVYEHKVLPGETLYAIAFKYDKDYRYIAKLNNLTKPYILKVGQTLRLGKYTPNFNNLSQPQIHYPKIIIRPKRDRSPLRSFFYNSWQWPINGRILNPYSPGRGQKGINIAGKKGEKVHAANDGVVAYSGNGLYGYGNLIIIKHSKQFLTAYGNNMQNLVREGQYVKKGQVIAEVGVLDRKFWGLHFEMRKYGKPVNPVIYLK